MFCIETLLNYTWSSSICIKGQHSFGTVQYNLILLLVKGFVISLEYLLLNRHYPLQNSRSKSFSWKKGFRWLFSCLKVMWVWIHIFCAMSQTQSDDMQRVGQSSLKKAKKTQTKQSSKIHGHPAEAYNARLQRWTWWCQIRHFWDTRVSGHVKNPGRSRTILERLRKPRLVQRLINIMNYGDHINCVVIVAFKTSADCYELVCYWKWTGTWMHLESWDIQLVTQSRRVSTDKPACRVSKRYRGGEPTLLWSGLGCLQSTRATVENKNLIAKLLLSLF